MVKMTWLLVPQGTAVSSPHKTARCSSSMVGGETGSSLLLSLDMVVDPSNLVKVKIPWKKHKGRMENEHLLTK